MENRRGGAGGPGGRRGPLGASPGQSTVEFLLIAMALAAVCCGLAAMWHAARDGVLLSKATSAASHGLSSGLVVALKDILGY